MLRLIRMDMFRYLILLILFGKFLSSCHTSRIDTGSNSLDSTFVCYDCSSIELLKDTILELHIFSEKCSINNSFNKLTKLERLNIYAKDINIDSEFEQFIYLKELNIVNANADDYVDIINLSPRINSLYLSLKDIASVNRINIEKLNYLGIISNDISNIPKGIFRLKFLKHLQLKSLNKTKVIPKEKEISNLGELEYFEAPINLKNWIGVIGKLRKLKYLGVHNVKDLTDDEIKKLEGLETIYSMQKSGLERIKKILPDIEIERR